MPKLRLLVLGSTRGSILPRLLPRLHELPLRIVAGVSDRRDCGVLLQLRQAGVPCHSVLPAGRTRECFDQALSQLLASYWPDIIIMLGYMRIASPSFVARWQGRLFNLHPSLLPRHAGLMDLAVHQAVLAAGEQESGCSIHRVTEVVDGGEVLLQYRCAVQVDDDALTLKARIQLLEVEAWYQLLRGCCEGPYGRE